MFAFCVKLLCGLQDPQFARTDVCVFCMNTAHQVATFLLPPHMESPVWMGVGDGNVIVFESGPSLFLFTISGHLLQRFEDHQRTIGNLWVVGTSLCPPPGARTRGCSSQVSFVGFCARPQHVHG